MTDLWADIWDKVRIEDILSEPSHEEIVARTANYVSLSGKTVLEVGSGSGGTAYELTKQGARVALMDLSPAALRLSHSLLDSQGVLGSYVCGDIHHIPFAADSFDISVSYGVLEHFPKEETVQILREMRRVTRGTIVTTVPNARCAFYRIAKWYAEKTGTWQYGYEQPEYSMAAYFQESGITLLEEETIGFLDSLYFLKRIPESDPLIGCALEFYKEHPDDLDGSLILSIGKADARPRKSVPIVAPSSLAIRAEEPSPLVSVIMPAYQAAPYIGHAVQSVLAQTWKDFELIVVDDGSTDSTRDILAGFTDPRIRYVYKTNGGEADACNFGLKIARGEFIAWLDADDLYHPDCLEVQARALLDEPGLSFVYPSLELLDVGGRPAGAVWRYRTFTRSEMIARLFQHGRSCIPGRASTMCRRSLLDRVGPFDTARRVSTDYDYLVRLVQEKDIGFKHIDRPLYRYRQVASGTSKQATERNRHVVSVMRKMIDRFPVEDLLPQVRWREMDPVARAREAGYQIGAVFLSQGLLFKDRDPSHLFFKEAQEHFQRTLQEDPTHAACLLGLARIHLVRNNFPAALDVLTKAMSRRPQDTEILVHLIQALLAGGQRDQALQATERFVTNFPNEPIAFNLLGYLYHQNSQPEEAIAAFEKALQLNPAYQEARDNLNALRDQAVTTSSSIGKVDHPGTMEFSRKFWEERGRRLAQGGFEGPGYETACAVTEKIFRELMAEILCGSPGKRFLEVGCGYGHSLEFLQRNFPGLKLTGIDFSSPLIMEAKKFLAGSPEIRLLQANAVSLPFSDGAFDVAFTHGLLIHIPPAHIRQAIVELLRVARIALISESSSGADTGYYFSHDYEALFNELGLFVRSRRVTDEKTNSRIFAVANEAAPGQEERTARSEIPKAYPPRESLIPLTLLYLADARSPHTQRLANFFAGRGHRVHIFDTSGASTGLKGVSIHTPALNGRQGIEAQFLQILRTLHEVIDQVKPDILHGHYLTGWGWWGACSGFQPYVLTAWGSDVFLDPQFSALNRRLNRFALRRGSLVTADSRDLLRATAALRGEGAGRNDGRFRDVQYVPFGIDLDIYHDGYDTTELKTFLAINGGQVVLSPRQFKPHSNLETLVHAIPGVLDEVPNTVFILKTYLTAGSPYEGKIRKLVRDLGVEGQVRFLSDMPAEQMPVLYNLADLIVSLRETDGSSCSMLEAMACKTPVVASDIPSMREWIRDGVNGRLVNPHDPRQVKEALVSLLKDTGKKRGIAEASYKLVRELGDHRKWWIQLENLYRDLVNSHPRSSRGLEPNSRSLQTGWEQLRRGLWARAETEFRRVTSPGKMRAEDLVEALFGLMNCALKSRREQEAAVFCRDGFTLLQKFDLDQMLDLER